MKKLEIKVVPEKVVYNHIKKEREVIRRMRYWIVVLATADILYTALMIVIIYTKVTG